MAMVEITIKRRVRASTLKARVTRLEGVIGSYKLEEAKLVAKRAIAERELEEAKRVYTEAMSRGLIEPPKPKGD